MWNARDYDNKKKGYFKTMWNARDYDNKWKEQP